MIRHIDVLKVNVDLSKGIEVGERRVLMTPCCSTFCNNVIIYFILNFLLHFALRMSMQNEIKM